MAPSSAASLRSRLDYEPVPLKFGTSGRRGRVADLTQLEVYLNARAELEYLQSKARSEGGIARGEEFYLACDLRPSSLGRVAEEGGRGGLVQAIARAVRDAGLRPVYLGRLPTPALANFAWRRGRGSIMITGSHIPFDRNGYKTNTSQGELLKEDEPPIQTRVSEVRQRLYEAPAEGSLFDVRGMLQREIDLGELGPAAGGPDAAEEYLNRYLDFFHGADLRGLRLVVYEHSAVGRDLLVELLERFGAEVIRAGRSETFVPIDTENIDQAQLEVIQSLAAEVWRAHGPIDAVVSTDGDSDRPLLLAVHPATAENLLPCQVRFFGGDLLGMVVAEYLGADAVVVPISCNDAIDRGPLGPVLQPKTRIGSPYVIAGMQRARAQGRRVVCGWEANGGFLTGSDIERQGRVLPALPTRDAVLPLLSVLLRAAQEQVPIATLFDRLPRRFSRAALLRNFPRPVSQRILDRFASPDGRICEVVYAEKGSVRLTDPEGRPCDCDPSTGEGALAVAADLRRFFRPELGFGGVARINYVDGIRVSFTNGDVAHIRPSGNADELRIYAVADTQERADAMARLGVAEPDGLLRQLEKAVEDQL